MQPCIRWLVRFFDHFSRHLGEAEQECDFTKSANIFGKLGKSVNSAPFGRGGTNVQVFGMSFDLVRNGSLRLCVFRSLILFLSPTNLFNYLHSCRSTCNSTVSLPYASSCHGKLTSLHAVGRPPSKVRATH